MPIFGVCSAREDHVAHQETIIFPQGDSNFGFNQQAKTSIAIKSRHLVRPRKRKLAIRGTTDFDYDYYFAFMTNFKNF